jgi:hypothetical protein
MGPCNPTPNPSRKREGSRWRLYNLFPSRLREGLGVGRISQ